MPRVRRALVSVSDKRGLVEFARGLRGARRRDPLDRRHARSCSPTPGIPVTQVSDYTGFPEMLDGRVKTLHPKIHGGLLGRRDLPAHIAAMREHGIEPIDLVVVNLYPFRETVAKPGDDARGGDRADRHRRPVDAALGGEEPRRRDRARRPRRLRRRARRAARGGRRGLGRDEPPARAEGLPHHRALRRRDRRLPRRARPSAASARRSTGAARRRSTCATARTRTSARRSTATSSRVAEPLHGKELSYNNIVDIDAALALAARVPRRGPRRRSRS